MPTTYESRKTPSGNPKNAQHLKKYAKVVLGERRIAANIAKLPELLK